jgi:PBP1b-binding outer membrane lipoprotein LpoB
MTKKSIIALLSLALLASGCVNTTYTKSIAVTKDATGKIIQTVETEGVVQPHGQGWPLKFEHLKGVQP